MEKNISKKVVVIGLLFLLLGAGVTLGASATRDSKPVPTSRGAWFDNFDSYATGSALHGQGGWAGWDNNAAATGYVTANQSRSSPNSVEIKWFTTVAADMVQQYSGINSGNWIYRAWQYVPTTMTGTQVFILMNTYQPGVTHNNPDWSLQLEFSASGGYIRDYNNVAATLPLIKDAWVQIRVEINFDADVQTVYYNNAFLTSKSWKNGVAQGGAQNLACVDLYAGDAASSSVYYDDLSVAPQAPPLTCNADGPYTGEVGQAVHFTGSASGGTTPYIWAWAFGDGGTSTDQNPDHLYTAPGTYDVTLKVTDAVFDNVTATTTATITVPPQPAFTIDVTGGKGINVTVTNVGDAEATNISYAVNITGGLWVKQRLFTGTHASLAIGANFSFTEKIMGIGLGIIKKPVPSIKVTVTCSQGVTQTKTVNAKIFLSKVTLQ